MLEEGFPKAEGKLFVDSLESDFFDGAFDRKSKVGFLYEVLHSFIMTDLSS